jgi:hypothetical protein
VLPRNEIALLNRAFFGETPQALQEKLLAFPAAQPANRFTVSCHFVSPFIETLLASFSNKLETNSNQAPFRR